MCVIATIAAQIGQLVADSGVDVTKIAGLGVAAPGPIDLDNGTVVDPPLLPGWDRVELRNALAKATGYSVLVDKDVTSAAVAETWAGGPSGSGSFSSLPSSCCTESVTTRGSSTIGCTSGWLNRHR